MEDDHPALMLILREIRDERRAAGRRRRRRALYLTAAVVIYGLFWLFGSEMRLMHGLSGQAPIPVRLVP